MEQANERSKRVKRTVDVKFLKERKIWYNNPRFLRKLVQYGFLITIILIGIQFGLWYSYYASGGKLFQVSRPAGVEGFLPLSGLISLKYWLLSGTLSKIHPSSVVLLLAILAVSLVFKKSFCGFICPVGLISEWFWKLSRKVFGKRASAPWGWRVNKFIDYPLRSIKYLLLFFFVNAILIAMNEQALKAFIEMPYNKVADAKMLLFFGSLTSFSFGVLILLAVGSLFITNFWCRYLCPYGALLGLVSFLSPVKIKRNIPTCTDCKACTRVCPAMIKVHKETRVHSDECIGCLDCVAACPVPKTLYPEVAFVKKRVTARGFIIGVLGIFMAFYITARMTGYWDNNISSDEYMFHIQKINDPEYNHFR